MHPWEGKRQREIVDSVGSNIRRLGLARIGSFACLHDGEQGQKIGPHMLVLIRSI